MKKFRLVLIFVGRASDSYIREGCRLYEERIRRYAELRLVPIPEERIAPKGRKEYILRQEGRRIRENLPPEAFTVALDEKGKPLTSEAFSRNLELWGQSGSREIVFILGGPYGLEESLKKKSDFCLSFSTMTLAHGMARMLLLEQVYRAFSILRGEPYHK